MVRIAQPTVADAERVASLGTRTFREAFAAQNTPEDLALYLERAFAPAAIAKELSDPRATWLLATSGDDDVGYAKLISSAPPPCVPAGAIELERFYVAAAWHGKGVAHALMRAVVDRARAPLWLGVWQKNPRAIAFYRKWDFAVVGAKTFTVGTDTQTDHVMLRTPTKLG